MLTIPEKIQDLYKAGNAWKNFRAVFADGSSAPIRNGDIVRESLKFTESVCSDNVFRFGGCERSMIEFETVGVDNILGKLLDCYIEIDTTSLSAAELSAIAADPGDGTLVMAADSDIGCGYYRIPLGRFRVAKCPRDHRATTHRQITAYSPKYWRLSPIEEAKLMWYTGKKTKTIDPERFLLANVGYWAPGFMESQGWSKTQVRSWSDFSAAQTISFTANIDMLGIIHGWKLRGTGTYRTLEIGGFSPDFSVGDMAGIHLGDFDTAGMIEWLTDKLTYCDWESTDPGWGPIKIRGTEDFIRYALGAAEGAVPTVHYYDFAPYKLQTAVLTGDAEVWDTSNVLPDFGGAPHMNNKDRGAWIISIPVSVTLEQLDENDNVLDSFTASVGDDEPAIYKWTDSDPDTAATVSLTPPVTDTASWTDTSGNVYTWRSWLGVEADKVIRGWMEINGSLLSPGRGLPKILQLSQAAPAELTAGNVSNFWWDEYTIEQIGSVAFLFGKNHDQTGEMAVGSGGSLYDMTDNGLLELAPGATAGAIRTMISRRMTGGLMDLNSYAPAEAEMPCWPWLEAGDALEFTAGDNTVVDTYIMQRTVSGVQLLWDEITAPGGEVEDDEDG